MEHKAFLFDFERFRQELMPLLDEALATGGVGALEQFVDRYGRGLREPASGEPLPDDWRATIEQPDAHQIGDIALTKYYDPIDDRGLGPDWIDVQRCLLEKIGTDLPLLGVTAGPHGNPFDPGKMGSYFQSSRDVASHLVLVQGIPEAKDLAATLRAAAEAGSGLYVTF